VHIEDYGLPGRGTVFSTWRHIAEDCNHCINPHEDLFSHCMLFTKVWYPCVSSRLSQPPTFSYPGRFLYFVICAFIGMIVPERKIYGG
jgi:hypothetical protein